MAAKILPYDARALVRRSQEALSKSSFKRAFGSKESVSPYIQSKELQDILESKHPLYKKMEPTWTKLQDLYLGENIEKYIFRHTREKEQNHKKRQERAYFFNYVQSIVDLIASFIFSKTILREFESPEQREQQIRQLRQQQIIQDYLDKQQQVNAGDVYQEKEQKDQKALAQKSGAKGGKAVKQLPPPPPPPPPSSQMAPVDDTLPEAIVESRVQQILNLSQQSVTELDIFWSDFDLRGNTINQYMWMIFTASQIFGHIDVFIDMDQVPQDTIIESEQDRKDLNLRPYGFVIFPLDLLNWEMGPDGKFLWIRWREEIVGNVGPFDKRSDKKSYRYYTWNRENFWVHEVSYKGQTDSKIANVELISEGENPLGEIPLARFFNKKHLVEPLMGVSAIKDIGAINIEILNICSLIDEETYQKSLNILVMQMPAEKKSSIEIGSNNVLLWEGDHQPYYLAPSSEPGNFMMEMIRMCIQEIYRLAKLGGDTGVQQAQSGIAYTWEFNQTNRMLADKADLLERGEEEVHRLWAKWMGIKWNGVIDYPDDFNVEKFDEEVKTMIEVKGTIRSPEFKRALEKKLASRSMAKMPVAQQQRIYAEIDVMAEEKPVYPMF